MSVGEGISLDGPSPRSVGAIRAPCAPSFQQACLAMLAGSGKPLSRRYDIKWVLPLRSMSTLSGGRAAASGARAGAARRVSGDHWIVADSPHGRVRRDTSITAWTQAAHTRSLGGSLISPLRPPEHDFDMDTQDPVRDESEAMSEAPGQASVREVRLRSLMYTSPRNSQAASTTGPRLQNGS